MADADAVFKAVYGLQCVEEWKTAVTATEFGGLGVRRKLWPTPMYHIRFQSVYLDETEAQDLVDFFSNHYGQLTTFTWTNPDDGDVYTCRFASDSLPRVATSYGRWDFDIELLATK